MRVAVLAPARSAPTSARRCARRHRRPPDRPRRAPGGAAEQRRPRAVPARRLLGAPAGDRRPDRGRARRLRVPRPQGQLVRDRRAAARAAAERRHGGRRRPERHPVVVLPRPRRARTRGAASRRSIPVGAVSAVIPPERAIGCVVYCRHRARGAGRRPPPRGHALLDRRAGRHRSPTAASASARRWSPAA